MTSSGWLDPRFDRAAIARVLVGADIDGQAFGAFFGPRLALYRAQTAERTPTKQLRAEIAGAMKAIEQLQRRLRRLNISEDAHLAAAWQRLAAQAREADERASVGRRESIARDWFLSDVAEWLEARGIVGAERAAEIAARCLRAARVPVPDPAEPKKARARVRAFQSLRAPK